MKNTSFLLTTELTTGDTSADGVLAAQGGRFSGWSLYLVDGLIRLCHNICGLERHYVCADGALPPSKHTVQLHFAYDGGGLGRGGTGTILVHGERIGESRVARTTPFYFSKDETLDIRRDRGTPVTEDYPPGHGNASTSELASVRFDLVGDEAHPSHEELLRALLTSH